MRLTATVRTLLIEQPDSHGPAAPALVSERYAGKAGRGGRLVGRTARRQPLRNEPP